VLGVRPILGRALTSQDDVAGAENVLVIAHGLWRRRYGGSHDVLGQRVVLNEQPFRIVGVMPPDVDYPRHVEAWMTVAAMQTTASNPTFKAAMARELDLLARLRPGVTIRQATAELSALAPQLDATSAPGDPRGFVPVLQSYREFVVGDVRPTLMLLFAAVGCVLLIASANVATLLLVRGAARQREFAVRAALGAAPDRLVRQLVAESGVLSLAAGVVALAATTWTLPVLLRWLPGGLPRVEVIRIDAGVAVFSLALTLLVVSLAGLVPAVASVQVDLTTHLRGAIGGTTTPASQRRRHALVVAQVALAVMLVAAAGLLVRSLLRLQDIGVQLATDKLVYVPVDLPSRKYADRGRRTRFLADLVAYLEATPVIAAVTPINTAPFSGLGWDAPTFAAEGQSAERAKTNPTLNLEEIHPKYFRAFEVALVRGRAFTADDREETMPVAIVSADVAALTWPDEDPIGKRLKMGSPDSPDPWRTVVGVAAPTRYREIRQPRATLYVPASQLLGAAHDLVVRTSAPLPLVADVVRSGVRVLDPDVHVMPLRPFSALVDVPLARPRLNAVLITMFGITSLVLAAIGLYAVMAASVRLRRREIGIRIALGATAQDVRRLVLGEGAQLVGLGSALGLGLAVLTSRVLRGLLFEVQPLDPLAFGATVALLVAVTGLALYRPMRQADRVDPSPLLRGE